MENINQEAPDPEKKKELKSFTFTRSLQNNEETPQGPKNEKGNNQENIKKEKEKSDKFILDFTLNLYEDEIIFNVKQRKENFKVANIIYEKCFSPEFFKSYKILTLLNLEKTFDLIQKSFELDYDQIILEENELRIKLVINIMDVLSEEINLEIPMIKMASQDEVLSLKESIKFLEQERNNQKKEISSLNETLEEIKKKDSDKENMIQELKNIIEANKIEFQKKLEEFQKKLEEKENNLKNKLEDNKAEINNKIESNNIEINNKIENKSNEINNKIEEKNNLYNDKIREIEENAQKRENDILTSVSENHKDIQGLQITQKYVNEKLICEEKEEEKEIEHYQYKRVLNNFNMEIHFILFEKKIVFNISEIQDDLKANPSLYENKFNLENLSQKTVHFKSLGNIPDIFKFIKDLLDNKKDTIEKIKNKIIINVKFPLGNKEEKISFDILAKKISLESSLKNINESLKEINKTNIITKAEFKKDLLEKVYPIGSYYWSEKNTSPSDIFGGSWTKIRGRFLFASDSNHDVGDTGGEETHTLTLSEMPSHYHNYDKFRCHQHRYETNTFFDANSGCSYRYPVEVTRFKDNYNERFLYTSYTTSVGGGGSHNNMPPFLTANCWKRTG
jgi:hypothetical protein